MSFRWKIILGVTAIQAALLVILIWNGLNILKHSSEDALLKRTDTTARLFASTAQAAVLATDIAALESFVDEVLSNPDIVYARVLSKQGVLAEKGEKQKLTQKFVADTSLASADHDGVFDAYADIVVAGEKYGRVEIGFSTSAIQQLISETRAKSFGFGMLNLALVGLFSLALGYYLTLGLNALQQGAKQIAGGDLGYRIDVYGKDELAQTALAFNDMSAKLKHLDGERAKKEEEILRLNQTLERRVIDRTTQLQIVNKQLEHQAMHDALTRLPNRALFHDRLHTALSSARRSQELFALVAMDMDMFKEINDTLGHHAGDLVLQHVANACNKVLRDSDTVARMGGDEFAILLPKVTDMERAVQVAQRVLMAIREPLQIDGHMIEADASIGIAMFPQHGEDELALITHSDAAMYEAKRQKLGVMVYLPEMGEGKSEAIALKGELRRAINEGEMVLHFQPKIDIGTRSVIGVEALVRWQHPRLGLLYPDSFIELAEMSGHIKPLTQEVLRLAMKQIREWGDQGLVLPIAVNISAVNLQDKGFPDTVASLIAEHEVPSHLLELEVTETAIMNDPITAIENTRRLSRLGVQMSIDDFGTGYSSMAYLQKLMVAKIKIDKSFVIDMGGNENDEVIVRSTIELAHNLGLHAVAEGVENQATWDKLREMGCDSAQGYLMSKPLPAEKFMDWVQSSPWCGLPPADARKVVS
ncbi:MAG: EAL domain-containing protein [Gallionella sp.]|nr:EAL domain-containing protein [Gallionella sp.]